MITEQGWPLKTFETYRTEWDAGVDARGQPIVVTDQMKSLDRMAKRWSTPATRSLQIDFEIGNSVLYDPYRPASDFPYESGTNLYPMLSS